MHHENQGGQGFKALAAAALGAAAAGHGQQA